MNKMINLQEVSINQAQEVLPEESYNKIKGLKYEKGQCLENAKKVAKVIGCSIIEGIVIFPDKRSIRHAWNVLKNDIYFDITAEKIWGDNMECLWYIYYAKYALREYETKDTNVFLSDAPIISNCHNAIRVKNSKNSTNKDFFDALLPSNDVAEDIRIRYWDERKEKKELFVDIVCNAYHKKPVSILDSIICIDELINKK